MHTLKKGIIKVDGNPPYVSPPVCLLTEESFQCKQDASINCFMAVCVCVCVCVALCYILSVVLVK